MADSVIEAVLTDAKIWALAERLAYGKVIAAPAVGGG